MMTYLANKKRLFSLFLTLKYIFHQIFIIKSKLIVFEITNQCCKDRPFVDTVIHIGIPLIAHWVKLRQQRRYITCTCNNRSYPLFKTLSNTICSLITNNKIKTRRENSIFSNITNIFTLKLKYIICHNNKICLESCTSF